jgi:hypothetical protein
MPIVMLTFFGCGQRNGQDVAGLKINRAADLIYHQSSTNIRAE